MQSNGVIRPLPAVCADMEGWRVKRESNLQVALSSTRKEGDPRAQLHSDPLGLSPGFPSDWPCLLGKDIYNLFQSHTYTLITKTHFYRNQAIFCRALASPASISFLVNTRLPGLARVEA